MFEVIIQCAIITLYALFLLGHRYFALSKLLVANPLLRLWFNSTQDTLFRTAVIFEVFGHNFFLYL
jgi:hypothetical protein